jgi:hypothetical protein|tara:strand:+ start:1344 stop:2057 length:714 start_codon:yes stop_codon:yes gene_type:complete
MATANINADKQTWADSGSQTSFTAARNATSSTTHVNYTNSQFNRSDAIQEVYSSGRGGGVWRFARSFFFFDTSSISGTITAIDLKIYGYLFAGNRVRIAKSTAFGTSGGSAYANSDFNNWTTLGFGGAPIPYSTDFTWTAGATNTIALNADAISNANSNNYINLVAVGQINDYTGNAPFFDVVMNSGIQFASTTEFPKLAITYTPSGYSHDVNAVASASIVSINGVANANIVTVNGV